MRSNKKSDTHLKVKSQQKNFYISFQNSIHRPLWRVVMYFFFFSNCDKERFHVMTNFAVPFLHRLFSQGKSW